jgi:hypothetical protein
MTWKRNVLVVANVTATSDELLTTLAARAQQEAAAFTLIVPATPLGGGRAAAQEKVQAAVQQLTAAGLEADGTVGDGDPIVAVTEAWDPKRYDEIVISTLPSALSKWLQADLPHRVERITGAPVTHIISEPPKRHHETIRVREAEKKGVMSPLSVLGWGGGGRAAP